MKRLLFVLLAMLAFNTMQVSRADETLPEIAPVEEPALPPLDAPASE